MIASAVPARSGESGVSKAVCPIRSALTSTATGSCRSIGMDSRSRGGPNGWSNSAVSRARNGPTTVAATSSTSSEPPPSGHLPDPGRCRPVGRPGRRARPDTADRPAGPVGADPGGVAGSEPGGVAGADPGGAGGESELGQAPQQQQRPDGDQPAGLGQRGQAGGRAERQRVAQAGPAAQAVQHQVAAQAAQAAATRSVWVLVAWRATIGVVASRNAVSSWARRPPPSWAVIRVAASRQPIPAAHCTRLSGRPRR